MKSTAIFYAHKTNEIKEIATLISKNLDNIKEYNIQVTTTDYMLDYENIIFGISNASTGQIKNDWYEIWNEFSKLNFSNKKVAIFCVTDKNLERSNCLNSMAELYLHLKNYHANLVGFTPSENYNFENTNVIVDNQLVGLAINLQNKSPLIEEKVKEWSESLKKEFV